VGNVIAGYIIEVHNE